MGAIWFSYGFHPYAARVAVYLLFRVTARIAGFRAWVAGAICHYFLQRIATGAGRCGEGRFRVVLGTMRVSLAAGGSDYAEQNLADSRIFDGRGGDIGLRAAGDWRGRRGGRRDCG